MRIKASTKRSQALTLTELLIVIVLLIFLVILIFPMEGPRPRQKAERISCVNNLKQIGTAYRVWENDNGGKYPMQQTYEQGGLQQLLAESSHAGIYAYLPYSIMQNEMGQSPKVVFCPADDHVTYNTNFYYGLQNAPRNTWINWAVPTNYGTFDNTNLSYFCGVGALDTFPESILGGDRNLGNGGVVDGANGSVSKPEQDPYYGISGTTASPNYPCGADAIVNTNGQWVSAFVSGGGGSVSRGQAVAWSAKMHSQGNKTGAGNILLGDGSSQQCTSAGLRATWLRNGTNLGNFATNDLIHSAARGDMRILFP